MTDLSTEKPAWTQEFDKRFHHEYEDCAAHGEGQHCCLDPEHHRNSELKSFISELLERERKNEQVKMAIRMSNLEQRATAAKSDDRQRILGIIEGKKIIDDPAGILGDTGIVKAWNRRIDEIREKISTGSPPNDQLREKINEN
jgi:hypothetical protein